MSEDIYAKVLHEREGLLQAQRTAWKYALALEDDLCIEGISAHTKEHARVGFHANAGPNYNHSYQ